MALIDMAMSPEEAKENYGGDDSDSAPKYSYGLRINLNDGDLEKLSITSLPEVGTKMTITCVCEVCSTGVYQDQSSEKEASMSLQIQSMEVSANAPKTDPASMLYG